MFILILAYLLAQNLSRGIDNNLVAEVLQAMVLNLAIPDHDLHAGWTTIMKLRATASTLRE